MIDQASKLRDQVRLVKSLRSTECPACAGRKGAGMTLCRDCWDQLPAKLGQALYRRVGHGYEPAFYDATCYLSAKGIYHPTETFTRPIS